MLLFGSLLFFLNLFGVWTVSKKRISRASAEWLFMTISFITLFFITGFRALDVGNDTPMYVRYFSQLKGFSSLSKYSTRFELGYRLFNCAIAQFFKSPHALLIITAFITIGVLFKIFRELSPVPVYSVLLYVGLTMYYSSFTMMRQYLAICLCLIGFYFLMQKKRVKFALFVLAGFLFHTSAIVVFFMLPLTLIPYKKEKRYWYILLGLGCAIFFTVLLRIVVAIFPAYASYVSGDTYYLSGKLGSVVKAMIYGILFFIYDYLYRKYGENTEKNKILYFCGLLGFTFTVASIQGAIISRIASYFNIVFCVSTPTALSWIPDRHKKYLWAALILTGTLLYSVVILYFRPNWTGALPYTFWD